MIELHLPADVETERLAIGCLIVATPAMRRELLRDARPTWFHDPWHQDVFHAISLHREKDGDDLAKCYLTDLKERWPDQWKYVVRIFVDYTGRSTVGNVHQWHYYAKTLRKLAEQRATILQRYTQLCEVCDEYRVSLRIA